MSIVIAILIGTASTILASALIGASKYITRSLRDGFYRATENVPVPPEMGEIPPVHALRAFLSAFWFATLALGFAILVLGGLIAFRSSPHVTKPLLIYGTIPVVLFGFLAVRRMLEFRRIQRSNPDGNTWKIELQ